MTSRHTLLPSQTTTTRLRKTSSANTPAHPQSSRQHPSYGRQSPNHDAHDVNSLNKRFPFLLFDLVEGGAMAFYIYWHPEGGLFIPSIERFAARVLPVHFPEMKAWGSFQKQLNNYGFEKQNRSTTEAWYTHWDNKFGTGCRELLPQVLRRPKALPPQFTAQDHPPAPNTPPAAIMVPPPSHQPDSAHRISQLEKMLEAANLELKTTSAKVSRMEEQLKTMEVLVQKMSDRLDALSIGSGLANSRVHTGPSGGAVGNQYPMNGPCHANGMQDGGGISQDAYSQMGLGMPFGAMGTTSVHQSPVAPTQLSTNTSSAGPPRSLNHAANLPAAPVPFPQEFLMESMSTNDWSAGPTSFNNPYSEQQPDAGPSVWAPNANANHLPPAPATQLQARTGAYSSGSSGRPRHFGGTYPVPPPSAPPSWF